MIYSLEMVVDCIDGEWWIEAPWLKYPITADSFEAAYWNALKKRQDGAS